MKRLLLALLLLTSSAFAQDIRVPEYDHTSITSDDLLHWGGSAWVAVPPSTVGGDINSDDLLDVAAWTDYSGSISYGAGGGTFTSPSTSRAQWARVGQTVFVYNEFSGTCGSTPQYITYSLPSSVASGHQAAGGCFGSGSGTNSHVTLNFGAAPNQRVYGGDDAGISWTNGTCNVWCMLIYRSAL